MHKLEKKDEALSQSYAIFSHRLRCALYNANMKPAELSRQTGIPKSMMSYYVKGKTKPKADRLHLMSQALDVSEAWLLGYEDSDNITAKKEQKNASHQTTVFSSQRLREALDASGMTQSDLARKTGLQRYSISRYLAGEHAPKQKALYDIALALNVSEAWLMGFEENKSRTTSSKNNDDFVQAISNLRNDPDFLKVISMLASLPPDDYESFKRILLALYNK